jgi:6-pyruvoyltetrahydropterin/6-carboxytetrahydropterin synthase
MYTIRKQVEFDAAHFLPKHAGKCRNLHGHRWGVTVEVKAEALNSQHMVVDFGDIKRVVRAWDHSCLNDDPFFHEAPPTAENIARLIWEQIRAIVEDATATVSVTVEESPGSSVTFSK